MKSCYFFFVIFRDNIKQIRFVSDNDIRNILEFEKDFEKLKAVYNDVKKAEIKLDKFETALKARWDEECNPHGYDVLDIRIGALKQRLKTAKTKIKDYEKCYNEELKLELLYLIRNKH